MGKGRMNTLAMQRAHELQNASQNLAVSRSLATLAYRAISRSRVLVQTTHERRRRPDFFYRLAQSARTFPRKRRFLPVCGADRDLLEIETEERPEGMVARVAGEIDLANVRHLEEVIQRVVTNCRNLIVDISRLRYIDAKGLHALTDAAEQLRLNGCQSIVVGASPSIAKVIRILHLDSRFHLVSSLDEAVELIRRRSSASAADG